jgi:enamine deaminase RidA (YjgF/YER057c/UK114 family)
MSDIQNRLKALEIVLPEPAMPVANYVPFTRVGNLVHISGQLSNDGQGGMKGTIGVNLSLEDGVAAARWCAINLLAQMRAAGGDLEAVVRILKLNVFVQCGPDFYDIPKVANGCSDLLVTVLGEVGKHARSAVGMYKIPLGFAVEADAVVEMLDRR